MHGMGGGHHRDCGPVNPDTVCRTWGYPANCGHVTPGAGSGVWGHPTDCEDVTPGAWIRGENLGTVVGDPRCMVSEGFTMETMDVQLQL